MNNNFSLSSQKQKISIIFIFALLILGCNFSSIATQENLDGEGNPILFFDDFSNPNSGWYRHRGDGVTDYENGIFHIFINGEQQFSWTYVEKNYENEKIEVEVAFGGGAEKAEMGVICRMESIDSFYFATIRSDGQFAIFKMEDGKDSFLGMTSYQADDIIRQGIATNTLELSCMQDKISFAVNGKHLIEVTDSSFSFGNIGLIAGTFLNDPDAHVYFDNFKVITP